MLLVFLSVSVRYCSHIFLYLGCSTWRSTPFLHGSIQVRQLVRFSFCWRALNRWPILKKGPSASLWAPVSRSAPIRLNRDRVLAPPQTTLPSYVFSYLNHRRASCTPSQEEISTSKHTALTPPFCVISYIKYWITAVVGTAGGHSASLACLHLVLRTASHRSAAWHSPCHRWTLAQELLIKEHVRTAPSCHPRESRHLRPSHTLLDTAVLIKGALGRTKRSVQNEVTSTKKDVCLKHSRVPHS